MLTCNLESRTTRQEVAGSEMASDKIWQYLVVITQSYLHLRWLNAFLQIFKLHVYIFKLKSLIVREKKFKYPIWNSLIIEIT